MSLLPFGRRTTPPPPAPRALTAAEEHAAAIARVVDNYETRRHLYAGDPNVLAAIDLEYQAAVAAATNAAKKEEAA